MAIKLAFIGFGGVGQSLAQILHEQKKTLFEAYGMDVSVVAVTDMMKGSVYNAEGLDITLLLQSVKDHNSVEKYPDQEHVIKGWDSIETIQKSNADVIVEVTFTDVNTGEPAITHCKEAFNYGKSVITTNKGPVALAYRELAQFADDQQLFFGFEGTVMSGTPALRLPIEALAGNEISEIKAILNGTTNYMLTEMEKGLSYDQALKNAQELGYAEADPTSDVQGFDARYKAVILSNYVMGSPIIPTDVECEGITKITTGDVKEANEQGETWRLLTRLVRSENGVKASVKPERISQNDPLAGVTGPTNAIVYECNLAGPIMLTGAGAGLKETGYSLLIDLIHYQKQRTLAKI